MTENRKLHYYLRSKLFIAESLISSLKFQKNAIFVNGKSAKVNCVLKCGDIITIRLSDYQEQKTSSAGRISILYDDEFLCVVNKPAGMVMHGTSDGAGGETVEDEIKKLFGQMAVFHPVNRLDRGTSGLCVLAKNGYIHERLQNILHSDLFTREYICLTSNCPHEKCGLISFPILPDMNNPAKQSCSPSGKDALTDYEVLAANEDCALIQVKLHSGRKHQIRVHMAEIGCPIIGDSLYGGLLSPSMHRPALHSIYVRFQHPVTNEWIEIKAPVPDDIAKLAGTLTTVLI